MLACGATLVWTAGCSTSPPKVEPKAEAAPAPMAEAPPRARDTAPTPVAWTPPATAGRAARAPKAGEVEVCGVGIVTSTREDPAGVGSIPLRDRARAQVDLMQLADHAESPQTKAVALTVAARIGEVDGKPLQDDAEQALQRLARLAAASKDPVVYALAVDSCRTMTLDRQRGGACKQISGEKWTRVDPGNAVPWLGLAGLAQARGDVRAEASAMRRASTAPRIEWNMASLADRLMEALPADTPPASRALLSHEARSISFHLGGVAAPRRYCTAQTMKAPFRRDICEKLAGLMMDKGSGLHDIGTAWRIGEQAGWPAPKVEGLRNEVEKLDRVVLAEQRGTYGPLSCGALKNQQDWARRVRAMGEVTAARDLIRSPAHVRLGSDVGTRRSNPVD